MRPIEASNRAGFWNASHPARDAGSWEKQLMSADTIIAFVIAHAIRECPDVLEAEVLKLMRRHAELLEENQELRRRVTQLQVAALTHGRR